MELNVNDKLKIRVLKQLSDGKVYSFYSLAKAVGANNTTVTRNCHFLHKVGLLKIDKVSAKESASGVPSYRIKITGSGLKAVKGMG